MRPFFALVCVALGSGCAAERARAPATPIEWSEAVPAGYESLGSAHAECRPLREDRDLDGTPATSVVCSRLELERTLEEQAQAAGGSMLARARCRQAASGRLACSAVIARAAAGTRPLPPVGLPEPRPNALPATIAGNVLIDFEPVASARFERRPRSADEVNELLAVPVGHVALGVMRAHCETAQCNAEQVHAGLRLAAGGLGVSTLVGVRCFELAGEAACVATLSASERDPETDRRAR